MASQPLARASLAAYNTREDVDALVESLNRLTKTPSPKPASGSIAAITTAPAQTVEYPKSSAASPDAAADELAEVFEFLESKEAKNSFLLEDLATKLPHNFDLLKQATERIPGCVAQVYLVGRRKPARPDVLEFVADADAEIVRGLIVLMQRLFSGQRVKDILAFDVEAFFRRIGLDQFITQQRRNGLAGMVNKIRSLASESVK